MPEKVVDAVTIALAGMVTVMVALIILMLAVIAITRLSAGRRQKKENTGPKVLRRQIVSKESIAAMAVAMTLASEGEKMPSTTEPDAGLGLRREASPWAASGRERLMRSRAKTGRGWGRPSN